MQATCGQHNAMQTKQARTVSAEVKDARESVDSLQLSAWTMFAVCSVEAVTIPS